MADKYISVEAMRKRLGIVPDGNCMKCQYGGGIGACMKPVYVEYICGELDKEPAADVVLRSCFNRILAENDTMREQLAAIGKKPGDSMDDVRRVAGHTEAFTNRDGETERITIHDNEPDVIIFQKNENGGYIAQTVHHATSSKNGNGDFVTVLSENAVIESIAYRERSK